MTQPRHIAVIDIGKTNAKLALVDLEKLQEISVVTRPNKVVNDGPWPHFDVAGHWEFLLDALTNFQREYGITGISITTHGASAVLLDENGDLAAPILDYEYEGPDEVAAEYDAIRPDFAETGSPKLARGLNVGAQFFWQFKRDPELHDRTKHVVTYPQYWGSLLTGVIASDVTSLGCHTDLWNPYAGTYSSLTDTLNISDKIAPAHKSTDVLGTVLPWIAEKTGLAADTPVLCGIHDSNASLYPNLLGREGAFSVVSTGTWVIAMAVGASKIALDPAQETFVNVDAFGKPVPSARFMGGREYEIASVGSDVQATPEDAEHVLREQLMLLPAVEPTAGPYKGRKAEWLPSEPEPASAARSCALSFYLALVTCDCLDVAGAEGPIIIEGPFSKNRDFLAMLTVASGREVMISEGATGTSIGAAMLFLKNEPDQRLKTQTAENHLPLELAKAYVERWRELVH
ncbi:FGGY-family carbohydrate kinase [Falsihalocynthiibacter sp. SS001]|uniref:FGGY-family carbohydrate kinase n=1 Tax=Falsihalocynthiibacter sp. SS001 TaxID=3349698 RepID=UPI0036D28B6C